MQKRQKYLHNEAVLVDFLEFKKYNIIKRCSILDTKARITELMIRHGWSEYRLAKESGLSQSTISNMFSRNTMPSISTLEVICDAFGLTLAQFFSEGEQAELTDEQRLLFSKWRTLTAEQKELLLKLMDNLK